MLANRRKPPLAAQSGVQMGSERHALNSASISQSLLRAVLLAVALHPASPTLPAGEAPSNHALSPWGDTFPGNAGFDDLVLCGARGLPGLRQTLQRRAAGAKEVMRLAGGGRDRGGGARGGRGGDRDRRGGREDRGTAGSDAHSPTSPPKWRSLIGFQICACGESRGELAGGGSRHHSPRGTNLVLCQMV